MFGSSVVKKIRVSAKFLYKDSLKLNCSEHCMPYINPLGWLKMHSRRNLHKVNLIHKNLLSKIPMYLLEN